MMNVLMHFHLRKELEDVVGKDWVRDTEADIHPLIVDTWWASRMLEKKNLSVPEADFVVMPDSAGQISQILKIAGLYDIPVIPRGGSASDTAGSIIISRGIILDMRRMNRVLDLDETSFIATVECGIMMSDLEQILNAKGYTTNHLPASMYCSTVGGFLSTRGSGVLSSKYGKIEDLVVSAKIILPEGESVQTCVIPRSSVGPELSKLFIGAEGTLGIIVEVSLQIYSLPEKRLFPSYAFKSLDDVFEAGRVLMHMGIKPAVMRVYDEADSKRMIKPVLGDMGEYEGVLVMGFDGISEMVDLEARIADKLCTESGGISLGNELGEKWWSRRYDFY